MTRRRLKEARTFLRLHMGVGKILRERVPLLGTFVWGFPSFSGLAGLRGCCPRQPEAPSRIGTARDMEPSLITVIQEAQLASIKTDKCTRFPWY